MTHHEENCSGFEDVMELLIEQGFDGMADAMRFLINEAMKLEREHYMGARPHERTDLRKAHANGFKQKVVNTRAGRLPLQVPQVRRLGDEPVAFYPQALEKGVRSERALKLAIAEMYVRGVSTRKVTAITQELCGLDISSTQVSRVAKELDEQLGKWRGRPLGKHPYVYLDARYEKVREGGSVRSCAVLWAVGVDANGKRAVLGVSVSLSEAEVHWRNFLESLHERGLHGVELVISDDHAGLTSALKARMPGVRWQRCQFHLQRNAIAYIPRVDMRRDVADDLRAIFNAGDREEANLKLQAAVKKYAETAARLSSWIEENIPEGLTVFELPRAHRRRLRTTNVLERMSKEVKRRTTVATLFPNEASLLRLVTAIVVEISEEWETGRAYLNMENP